MKKVLITNAFGPQNRGDHELLQQLIGLIRKKHQDEVEINVLTVYPEQSRKSFSRVSFYKSPFYRPKKIYDFIKMMWDLPLWFLSIIAPAFSVVMTSERKNAFRLIKGCDILFMCPGGYMYSNGLSYYANIINGLPIRSSKAKKIASPMSIGPFNTKFDYCLAKYFFKKFDYVFARESYSFDLAVKMNLKVDYSHDLAWLDEEVEKDDDWKDSYVGTVIDWSYNDIKNCAYFKDRYINEFVIAIKALYNESKVPVILYNQVGIGDGKSLDEILIKKIVLLSDGCAIFKNNNYDPSELKSKIAGAKGVIASRFHSALFSIQVSTPFVAIAYQPKAEYILKDLALDESLFDISSFNGEDIANKLIELSGEKSLFGEKISNAKYLTRKNILEVFFRVI